jgi:hypothetical protein
LETKESAMPEKRKIIKPQLMEYFQKSPGLVQYVNDLAKNFGVNEHQMQECIAGIIRGNDLPGLAVEIRGRSWCYKPTVPKSAPTTAREKRMFEEIGETRDGSIIMQDEGGKLYSAKEL